MATSYLNSVNYSLDQQFPVNQLSYLKGDVQKQEKYSLAGLKYHFKTEKSASELAYTVLSDFLEKFPSVKQDIDSIIFTTDDLDRSGDISVETINAILSELELSHVFPLFQSGANCANICASFFTACSMVESGRSSNVLVVSVDKLSGEDNSYIMKPEMSVLSDAGICLWISSAPIENALIISGIFQKNNPQQWLIDREKNYQAYSTNKLKILINISKQVKNALGGDIHHLIMNNYFKHINEMFLGMMSIKANIADFSNVERVGHAPAGDVFINLIDLINKEKVLSGENIVLVADSPSLCMGLILRKEK